MKTFILILLFGTSLIANSIDLEEEFLQDFVIETKRIQIPDFPYAFNPSLVRWNGLYLMCFRAGKEYQYKSEEKNDIKLDDYLNDSSYIIHDAEAASSYSPNRIGLVWLDDNLNPITKPQLLDIPNNNPIYRQQDPRLVVVGERIFLIYSDMVPAFLIPQTKRVIVAELGFDGLCFYTKYAECLVDYDGEIEARWEKNWVPFEYENKLLLAYSINPHKIFYPLLEGTGVCSTIASTEKKNGWKWGQLRGGSQALLESGNRYLAFFHSSVVMDSLQSEGKKLQHYFMGAYTFSSEPPFEMQSISPMPIVGKNFYNGAKYKTWKPIVVVFPGGFTIKGKYVYVAYGRQDHEIWIAKLDKERLLASLVPVHL